MAERTPTDGLSDAVWDFTALLQSLHLASSDSADAHSVQNSLAPANVYSTEAVQHRYVPHHSHRSTTSEIYINRTVLTMQQGRRALGSEQPSS